MTWDVIKLNSLVSEHRSVEWKKKKRLTDFLCLFTQKWAYLILVELKDILQMELTLSILETTVWQNWETRRRQRAYCSSVWWSKVGILCFFCNSLMFITFSSAKVTGKIKSKWVNAFKNVKGQQGQQNNQAGAVKLSLVTLLISFESNTYLMSSFIRSTIW